ncbi:MAG: anthranilate synthase component I family protein [Nitrospirae bacterium]|nr:MAG: anthranilate synthase component I family protein [Nitrospirota bacterium]
MTGSVMSIHCVSSAQDFLHTASPPPLIYSYPLAGHTPFELYCRMTACASPSFLLESGERSSGLARYSFFGDRPFLEFIAKENRYQIRSEGQCIDGQGDAFARFWELLGPPKPREDRNLPPFLGGAVGMVSYDLVRQFERLPTYAKADLDIPDLHFLFIDRLVAIDHEAQTVHLVFAPAPSRVQGEARDRLYREGKDALVEMADRLFGIPSEPRHAFRHIPPHEVHAEQSACAYQDRVRACQAYIESGDIYQANLSHRFTMTFPHLCREGRSSLAAQVYRQVNQVNPSPFSALLSLDQYSLVSNSPELLLRKRGHRVDTRPIAGTFPRGATGQVDREQAKRLLADPKERAEHVMLVDLARNDLGRVCRYGTIRVEEFMTVARYSHVFHLESLVSGLLQDGIGNGEILKAVFPGGTITGVPKIRCMELIDQLEPVRRGPYTGSIGYVSWAGDMDWNILIRTLVLTDHCGYLQVGAGIVADSVPLREYRETLAKAQAFFQALS